jgi:hypothetical protein
VYRAGVKKRTDDVSHHKFKVGQTVLYTSGVGSSRRSDIFTVMQRLPPQGGTNIASRALASPTIALPRKVNSNGRCDRYGLQLQRTG